MACKDGHFLQCRVNHDELFFSFFFFLCCPATQPTNTRRHAIPEKISLWRPLLNLVEKPPSQAVLCSLRASKQASQPLAIVCSYFQGQKPTVSQKQTIWMKHVVINPNIHPIHTVRTDYSATSGIDHS